MLVAEDLSQLVIFARQLDRGTLHSVEQIEELIDRMQTELGKKLVNDLLLEFWQEERLSFIWKLV